MTDFNVGDIVGVRLPGTVFDGCAGIVVLELPNGGAYLGVHTRQTDYPLRSDFTAEQIVPWEEVIHGSGRPPGVPPTLGDSSNPLVGRRKA